MQKYPFVEIDENQDIMQQVTPYIRQNSLEMPWDSFYLLDMEFPAIIVPEISWDAVVIACYLDKKITRAEISAAGQKISRQFTPGSFGLWKPHFPVGLIWYEPIHISKCILSVKHLERIALETVDRPRVNLTNCWWDREDPLVFQIVQTLMGEMAANCPHGRIYGDTLIAALCAHLLFKYNDRTAYIKEYRGGLSRPRLNLALEYIHDRITDNISLLDIATELDMSQYHFCRLFKQSMEVSPHQYIIQKRIEKSQELLKKSSTKIADVAIEVGFANQGHFNFHFRKLVGITPRQYRNS
jgi:AraC family transcriptional regulator